MVRISGINIPTNKHVWVGLTYVYGIGRSTAFKICEKTGIESARKVATLSEDEAETLRQAVNEYTVEGDRRREVALSIKRLMDLNCYRGIRHKRKLPCRGQRTRTNARTRKGPNGNKIKKRG